MLKAGGVAAGLGLFGQSMAWADLKASGKAAEWPSAFEPTATAPKWDPRAMPAPGDQVKVFDLEVTIAEHEILPGVTFNQFLFNKQYPGPTIRVNEGDWVQANLVNHSPESHTIHWHGMQIKCEMDGVPLGTQWPVMPNQEFKYLFRAQPGGTHFYHCHVMTPLHVQAGLAGALIVDPVDDPIAKAFPYEREYTMMLSEIDTNYVRDYLNEMMIMGKQMDIMNHSAALMKEMNGRMMGWFKDKDAFKEAVKGGYIPPYSMEAVGARRPITPNFFMINGKAYPMTEELMIKSGETIRIRLIGGGLMLHSMHLHGHDFWHVAQDGNPLPNPIRLNTIPIYPGTTSDIIVQGTNPGHWHFHDHSDMSTMNNGVYPGGIMTMLMYEDAADFGFTFKDIVEVSS